MQETEADMMDYGPKCSVMTDLGTTYYTALNAQRTDSISATTTMYIVMSLYCITRSLAVTVAQRFIHR